MKHSKWLQLLKSYLWSRKISKNYQKHKRNELNNEELIIRLRIKEENRSSKKGFNPVVAKTHIVEYGQTSSCKGAQLETKGGISINKFQVLQL